jgi:hypothetical protein
VKKSFIDKFYEENAKSEFWGLTKKVGIVFVAIFLAITIMINTTGCTKNDEDVQIENSAPDELQKDSVKVGDDGINAAIAPDDVSVVSNQSGINTGKMVAMSVEDTGRADPFLPENEHTYSAPKTQNGYDLLPPPESITVDTTATELITTKVSGIMYDSINPSAILNINGSDYLVRTGDIINNYKVLSIGRTMVTVQNGANIYKAGVGEIFSGDGMNFNTISNLESKFGGHKNSANKR